MKKPNVNNPLAKSLRDALFRKRIVENKRKKILDKLRKREAKDGKTNKDY